MSLLTAGQVAQHAYQAGFRGDALITAVAVSHAETDVPGISGSGGPFATDARGDVGLENNTWGASIGLWQIRSLRADFGTGRTRDEQHLLDPAFNARSAYAISSGGSNFKPWSTYTSGKYRNYLADARAAATGAASGTPAAATSGPVLTSTTIAAAGPVGAVHPITIGGRLVTGTLGVKLVGGEMDFSTNGVSELTVEWQDADFALRRDFDLNVDSGVTYAGVEFRVIQLVQRQGPAHPHLEIKAHPEGVVRLRTTVPTAATTLSPTEYVHGLATQAGLRFVGEPSGARPSIGPASVKDPDTKQLRTERAWEVAQRLADDLGFLLFEAGETLFFGSGLHLATIGQRVQLSYLGWSYPAAYGLKYDLTEFPTCTASRRNRHPAGQVILNPNGTTVSYLGTVDNLTDANIRGKVRRDQGETLRPGMAGVLASGSTFDGDRQLVTRARWSLADTVTPVDVEIGTPAAKTGANRSAADDTAAADAARDTIIRSGASALDFVTLCLKQVGDAYVYGAVDDPNDPNPTSFDCSSLVQWGARQVGVRLPRTSTEQWLAVQAAGLTLTVAQAGRTRGAVLYRAGTPSLGPHIVISLGDGVHTVEARGRKWGVIQGPIAGRTWTGAGKLPGLVYR